MHSLYKFILILKIPDTQSGQQNLWLRISKWQTGQMSASAFPLYLTEMTRSEVIIRVRAEEKTRAKEATTQE